MVADTLSTSGAPTAPKPVPRIRPSGSSSSGKYTKHSIYVSFSDATRIKKVENQARTRILEIAKFENENVENFSMYNFRESRMKFRESRSNSRSRPPSK